MSKAKLKPSTIKKLRWVQARIRRYPHKYYQGTWCGTSGCIAGFCLPKVYGYKTVVLSESRSEKVLGRHREYIVFPKKAGDWLGLTKAQRDRLFASEWEGEAAQYNRRFFAMEPDQETAEKTCNRIDLFIESGGTK